jgi:hypothetical protein
VCPLQGDCAHLFKRGETGACTEDAVTRRRNNRQTFSRSRMHNADVSGVASVTAVTRWPRWTVHETYRHTANGRSRNKASLGHHSDRHRALSVDSRLVKSLNETIGPCAKMLRRSKQSWRSLQTMIDAQAVIRAQATMIAQAMILCTKAGRLQLQLSAKREEG